MSLKPRACGAIIRGDKILMVKHSNDHEYWSLPGGHIEPDEKPEAAAVREVWEEVGLKVEVDRLLYEGEDGPFYSWCFLLKEKEDSDPKLGHDPEMDSKNQILKDFAWFTLEEKKDDVQVSEVIKRL